ncbi:MAG: hypothetical protein IIB39_00140 [Candidatus Marinimicrobia bacterium]|nr:hypothetical protein [Candidatus Neomarinimicrobiota bacterium]
MLVRDLMNQHPDGAWEAKQIIVINHPSGEKITLRPGIKMNPGFMAMGFDIIKLLDIELDEKDSQNPK